MRPQRVGQLTVVPFNSHTENLIATLPNKRRMVDTTRPLQQMLDQANSLRDSIALPHKLKPHSDGIILATHTKCGNTSLKALKFAIVNRSHYSLTDHPLLVRRPHEVVPFVQLWPGGLDGAEELPSPRLLSTYLQLSLLPQAVSTLGCRIVCVCRDPKDAFVSRWHFEKRVNQGAMSLDMALKHSPYFVRGAPPYGPFWERYLEYWKESLARLQEVMFLRYEDVGSDTLNVIRKLASFLGFPFTQEEENGGVVEQIADLCGFTSLSNIDANRAGRVEHSGGELVIDPSSLFRKGKVGDWVNHMSKEMGDKMDQIVSDKFQGS